jgi:hypothetical protein
VRDTLKIAFGLLFGYILITLLNVLVMIPMARAMVGG